MKLYLCRKGRKKVGKVTKTSIKVIKTLKIETRMSEKVRKTLEKETKVSKKFFFSQIS